MGDVRLLNWDRPFLPAAAEALAGEGEEKDRVDLSRMLLVVPGARAGRRLLELLLEVSTRREKRLVPPCRILTVGSLPEELHQPRRPLASTVITRLAWMRAIDESHPGTRETALGPAASEELDSGSRLSFARLLDSLHRTIGAAGVSFGSVARECGRGFLFSDEERWEALAQLQAGMRRALSDAGFSDRELARWEALDEGRVATEKRIVLVGVAELPLITRRMLGLLTGGILALVHGPEGGTDGFDELGLIRPDWWQHREVPVSDEDLVVVDGPRDQAEAVVSRLADAAQVYPLDRISVGVPDSSLVPYLARQLETRGLPSRYAEGEPLSLSPPVLLLHAVSAYLATDRFDALADLLRHPDLPSTLHPELAPELADRFFQEHLPDVLDPQGSDETEGKEGLERIRALMHRPELLGRFQGTRPLSEWMPEILSFLAEVYGEFRTEGDPQGFRVVVESAKQVRDAADSIHRLPPALDSPSSANLAFQLLLGELRKGRIPPEQEESAVEMVGWLELQLDDAPVILVAGVTDPFLPEALNADPFLPNAIRGRLGLEDNQSRYARDVYRLTALVRSTSERLVVTGRRAASGDPLRPSRLLLTGSGRDLARRVLVLTGTPEGPGPPHPEALEPEASQGSQGFALPPEPFIPLPRIPQPLPVTAFRSLLADPYLWAMENVLGLREVDHDLRELDPMGFGNLAHAVLERFAGSEEVGALDADEIRARLFEILRRTVASRFRGNPLPTVPLQVEQLKSRLARFSDWQAQWRAEGWEVVSVEARTPPDGVPFGVDEEPVFLSGRIDRIDRNRHTGEWVLMDYKTGESGVGVGKARLREGKWKDLQLPLYRLLLQDLRTADGNRVDPPSPGTGVRLAYLHLSKEDHPIQVDWAPWDESALESAYEAARTVIRDLRRDRGVHYQPGESGRKARGQMASLMGQGSMESPSEGESR